jgi:hypothetical protein
MSQYKGLAFYPLAIKQRLRRRRIRLGFHLATLNALEIERLRRLLTVEQVLHHEKIRFRKHGPSFQVSYFDGIKAEQFREYGRSTRGRLHMKEIGGRQLDEHLPVSRRDIVHSVRISRPIDAINEKKKKRRTSQ